jgi:hypothetical protein
MYGMPELPGRSSRLSSLGACSDRFGAARASPISRRSPGTGTALLLYASRLAGAASSLGDNEVADAAAADDLVTYSVELIRSVDINGQAGMLDELSAAAELYEAELGGGAWAGCRTSPGPSASGRPSASSRARRCSRVRVITV